MNELSENLSRRVIIFPKMVISYVVSTKSMEIKLVVLVSLNTV